MKILLTDRTMNGHRKTYMEWLSRIPGEEFYVLAPENPGVDSTHFTEYSLSGNLKSINSYLDWIRQIKYVAKKNIVDIVHILDGDSVMRWFGIGFGSIDVPRMVITYHHFFFFFLRQISYRSMCRGESRVIVAHTEAVAKALRAYGIKNIARCEYPAFDFASIVGRDSATAKEKMGVPSKVPVIGIIGGMSSYKNIIPFLETMQNCSVNFHLLICGRTGEISEDDIRSVSEPYKDRVTLKLKYLSGDEYEEAIAASDIIYCIYGHEFNGASGPLTDGVCAKKIILSCSHGSLGAIVRENALGFTAECDDRADMLSKTERALHLVGSFHYNDAALKYRERLNPVLFQKTYKKIYEN